MPINMAWNLMRKKDKPLTIELNGEHCNDEKLIAEKFAEHISEQEFQPVPSEPQPSQSLSSHYWKFKYVTPEDVRKRIKVQKLKTSVGPDGISPAFLKKIAKGTSVNIAN